MPIPKQDKRKPEPLKVSVHPDILGRLEQFSALQESDKDYVVEQVLKAFFDEEDRLATKAATGDGLKRRGRKPHILKEAVA